MNSFDAKAPTGHPLEPDVRLLATLMDHGRGETGLTEFFAQLLRVPAVSQAFLCEVLGLHLPKKALRAVTVVTDDDAASERGVPDISIRAADDLFVLVENKLGASFTANQPHEYLRSLMKWKDSRPSGRAMLVVQVPDARVRAVTEETWRLLEDRLAGLPRTDSGYGGVEIRVISWSATGQALADVSVEHPVVSYLLRSFLHLLPLTLESTSRTVTEEYLMKLTDKAVLEALAAAEDVLRDVGKKLQERYEIKTPRNQLDFTYCGFDAYPRLPDGKKDEEKCFSVSLSARFGAKFGVGPLHMSLANGYTKIEALKRAGWQVIPGKEMLAFEWAEYPAMPLQLRAGLKPQKQSEQVIADIEEIRRIALG